MNERVYYPRDFFDVFGERVELSAMNLEQEEAATARDTGMISMRDATTQTEQPTNEVVGGVEEDFDQPLAGPVYYADDTQDWEDWYPSSEDELDGAFHPGMATPPPPLSSSSDSGNDEPPISIEELDAERNEDFIEGLQAWLDENID